MNKIEVSILISILLFLIAVSAFAAVDVYRNDKIMERISSFNACLAVIQDHQHCHVNQDGSVSVRSYLTLHHIPHHGG